MLHERHRIFPAVFEKRNHKRVIDLSAGVGIVARNIREGAQVELVCNELSPKCLEILNQNSFACVSFDLDEEDRPFPIEDASFDAVITLATIEHLLHIDHFIEEIRRILKPGGYLYISAPNYSGILSLIPFLISGRTFHNPLNPKSRYEFYAHLRYFTFRTLVEYISSFRFALDTVYLPLPKKSTLYQRLKSRSLWKAFLFRTAMGILYRLFSPRWASEPVLCFQKADTPMNKKKARKVIL
jgi:SAM-dependent methyltransferase